MRSLKVVIILKCKPLISIMVCCWFSAFLHAADKHEDNPSVDDVPKQFEGLATAPNLLRFHDTHEPAADIFRHYQCVIRANESGVPRFFVSQNGNFVWSKSGRPGRIHIVEMGSAPLSGEPIGRLPVSLPTATDRVVTSYSFAGNNGWPHYAHAGGMQLVGQTLVVPLETQLQSNLPQTAVAFVDVANPLNASVSGVLTTRWSKLGAVAVTRLATGQYLMLGVDSSRPKELEVFLTRSMELRATDFEDCGPILVSYLNSPQLRWPDSGDKTHQTLNFVRDKTGTLYLIGARAEEVFRAPCVDLLEVLLPPAPLTSNSILNLRLRHITTLSPPMATPRGEILGNLRAASGVYSTQSGRLALYTMPHTGRMLCRCAHLGEFVDPSWLPSR